MNIARKLGFIAVFLISIFMLISCDGSKPFQDLSDYIANLKGGDKAKEDTKQPAMPSVKPPVNTKYESKSRRSPFEVREITNTKNRIAVNPLQAYPLDMLRFVGTVTQDGKTIAFISAPDSRVYQIKVGDIVGDRSAKVVSIDSDRISLVEQTSELGQQGMKRVVTLKLKETSQ